MTIHKAPIAALTASLAALLATSAVQAGDTDAALSHHWQVKNANLPQGDASAMAALWTADGSLVDALATLHVEPMAERRNIEAFFAGFGGRYEAIEHVEERHCTAGAAAYWEGRIRGAMKDGGEFDIPVLFAYDFDDSGLVREERIYIAPPAK